MKEKLTPEQKKSSSYLLNQYMRGKATYEQVAEACRREKFEKQVQNIKNYIPNLCKKWGLTK